MKASPYNPPRGRQPSIEWVPIADLRIDDSYQRSIETSASQKLIAAIARDWDWDVLDVLKVSRRPDDELFVIDGQHRKAAAALRGDIPQLPCVLKRCDGPAEEARLFIASNRGRKAMSRIDDFRAAIGAGDAESMLIDRLVREAGFTIARHEMTRTLEIGELANVAGIRTTLRKRGEGVVGDALKLMGAVFGGQRMAAATPMFAAIVDHLSIESPPATMAQLDQVLRQGSFDDWSGWADLDTLRGGGVRSASMRRAIRARRAAPPPVASARPARREPAPPVDDGESDQVISLHSDRVARSDATQSSSALLRAQLSAGQHLLLWADAKRLGRELGMRPGTVRPAANDPTAPKEAYQ